jgi:hypothetical protein
VVIVTDYDIDDEHLLPLHCAGCGELLTAWALDVEPEPWDAMCEDCQTAYIASRARDTFHLMPGGAPAPHPGPTR